MDRTSLKKPAWLTPLLFVCGLSAISFFWGLSHRDLWGADEMRYASTVREMLESGDWISPQYNRKDDGEKPPLFYWLGAITASVRGEFDELATLIPSALGGLLALWFTLLLGQRLLGHPGGYFAAAMLAATIGFSWQARIGQIDTLFTGLLMGSLYGFFSALQSADKRGRHLLLAYAALALAWMAKGPACIVLVGIAGLAYFWFVEERRSPRAVLSGLGKLGLWWGIPLFLSIVAPWYVALGLHQPNGWQVVWRVLWFQNVERYTNFWWETHDSRTVYFRIFTDLLPWTPAFLAATILCWRRDDFQQKLRRFAAAWFVAVFVFFFLSESRRAAYLMPIHPAAAFLAASLWLGAMREPGRARPLLLSQKIVVWIVTGGAVLFAAQQIFESRLPERLTFPYPNALGPSLVFIPIVVAGAWMSLAWLRRGRVLAAFGLWIAALLAAQTVIFHAVIPAVDAHKSRRKEIADLVAPAPSTANVWCFENERPWMVYYSPHRFAGYREGDEQLHDLLEKGDYLLVGDKAKAKAKAKFGDRLEVLSQSQGKAALYLIRCAPPASGTR